jgi:hypothetical protein
MLLSVRRVEPCVTREPPSVSPFLRLEPGSLMPLYCIADAAASMISENDFACRRLQSGCGTT